MEKNKLNSREKKSQKIAINSNNLIPEGPGGLSENIKKSLEKFSKEVDSILSLKNN